MAEVIAKVAAILNKDFLALNKGANEGVEKGNTVVLYTKFDIKDPDSGEHLGGVLVPKVNLKVDFVSAKFSTASVTSKIDPDAPYVPTTVRPTKTVTDDVERASDHVVFVQLGDTAKILINDPGDGNPFDEEPPF